MKVFLTGSTGYMGRRLAAELLKRGHEVTALARSESKSRVPRGCQAVFGDALEAGSYSARVPRECVFVHLVGVARPNPRKAAEFQKVDLPSIRAAARKDWRHSRSMPQAERCGWRTTCGMKRDFAWSRKSIPSDSPNWRFKPRRPRFAASRFTIIWPNLLAQPAPKAAAKHPLLPNPGPRPKPPSQPDEPTMGP